jgi:hypothetical protein
MHGGKQCQRYVIEPRCSICVGVDLGQRAKVRGL